MSEAFFLKSRALEYTKSHLIFLLSGDFRQCSKIVKGSEKPKTWKDRIKNDRFH